MKFFSEMWGVAQGPCGYILVAIWNVIQSQECFKGYHGGHKPGILRDYSEHGKLRNFSGNSVQPQRKIVTNKVFLVRHSNIW